MTAKISRRRSVLRITDPAREVAEAAGEIVGDAIDESLAAALSCGAVTSSVLRSRCKTTWAAAWRLARQTPPCDRLEELLECGGVGFAALLAACESAADAVARDVDEASSAASRLGGFAESFLAAFDGERRRKHGIYFTPPVVAEYLVARADAALAENFPATSGLAGAGQIFDPAVGAGVFPLAVIDRIYAALAASWRAAEVSPAEFPSLWDNHVRTRLLPRLHGCELLPAPLVVAQLLIGARLAFYGFCPRPGDRLQIDLADALSLNRDPTGSPLARSVESNPNIASSAPHALPVGSRLNDDGPLVVLGNPPYRGVSASEHAWIERLLRGESPDGRAAASYFHVDGAPLGEKKHWLHDDYVKFFRLAQWQIEQAGAGVIAFVTNHGFLDNPTFRGMRCGLLETFSEIEIVDLHGNVKHGAAARDESVFTTQQGMALSLLVARPRDGTPSVVRRADLLGTRREKLARLQSVSVIPHVQVHPQSPNYFFHAQSPANAGEYERFWAIDEIMPVSTTAIVTARDSLVTGFTREELIERLELFCDLTIDDERIRRELFPRSRTGKYPPGDTRGWKLREARERMAADVYWRDRIRACLYRPCDRREIYWSPTMIDWPRVEVMRHMERGDNLAIVCRRQQVRGAACNFFWIADDLVIDGYIRSDNRGSESIFPLWVERAPNFAPPFLAAVKDQLGDAEPLAIVRYIYAIFHSLAYRQRYAEPLTSNFPRVPLPRSRALFDDLSALGAALVDLHLLRDSGLRESGAQLVGNGANVVAAGYPKFCASAVAINPEQSFSPISFAAWQFQVGAHQVLRKWLKDRRGRTLTREEIVMYGRITRSIEQTLAIVPRIDEVIAAHGGWPQAFVLEA